MDEQLDDTRPFPIQADHHYNAKRSTIPWWLAEIAYAEYARRYGKDQSLQRLADRGGFGRSELLTLLTGGDFSEPNCMCPADGFYALCPVHRRGSLSMDSH